MGQPSFKKVRDMISLKFYKALKQNNFPDLLAMSKLTKKKKAETSPCTTWVTNVRSFSPHDSAMQYDQLNKVRRAALVHWMRNSGIPSRAKDNKSELLHRIIQSMRK